MDINKERRKVIRTNKKKIKEIIRDNKIDRRKIEQIEDIIYGPVYQRGVRDIDVLEINISKRTRAANMLWCENVNIEDILKNQNP